MSVVINKLQITNNAEEKRSAVVETILKPLLSKQNSNFKEGQDGATESDIINRELQRITQKNLLDFRDKKLPPSLIMFAQVFLIFIIL